MISPHHFYPTNGVRPSDSCCDGILSVLDFFMRVEMEHQEV
jgi:hypothetical protein